ncbi:MAG TPA: argininosuccinate lyase [Candidatus Bathyarchaeia archaeon]|nr:argininosuccinate lyase [Candidatus Bathyarchaeia archaeon]
MSSILRSGRLTATRKDVVNFISSLHDDKRIAYATVLVNEAHVIALVKAKAIDKNDARKLLQALRQLEKQIPMHKGVEDIHVLIEENIIKNAGQEVGGRLHVAKSRNDQVVTAVRMILRDELLEVSNHLLLLEKEILRLAHKHVKSVFPGYTHLQPAQPISFAHYLLSIGDAFLRDNQRIHDVYRRVNNSPMGAGALAGSSINVDRRFESQILGFEGFMSNTLDAVGSRDFALEALSVFSITALDLSRVAQDIIFYSSADVGILNMPDKFASTSSIMPQKKNPDPLEIIRATTANVVGNFVSAATMLHGLTSGYNLDFQEITPLIWRSSDTIKSCLSILAQIISGLEVEENIAQRDYLQFTAATEIANLLVRKEKLPFRTAHRAVGHTVRMAMDHKKTLSELTPIEWQRGLGRAISKKTLASLEKTLDLAKHITYYRTKGSPNPNQTRAMVLSRNKLVTSLLEKNSYSSTKLVRTLADLKFIGRKI